MDYTSVDQLAAALDISQTDFPTAQLAVSASTSLVDTFCGRNFDNQLATTRVFEPSDWLNCPIDDFASITTLKTDTGYNGTYGTTWLASDFETFPINGIGPNGHDGWPITAIRTIGLKWFPMGGMYRTRTVQVLGTPGWAAVPDDVTQAALFLAAELFKASREAPFGTANLAEFGPLTIRGNPRVQQLLAPYKTITAVSPSFTLV